MIPLGTASVNDSAAPVPHLGSHVNRSLVEDSIVLP